MIVWDKNIVLTNEQINDLLSGNKVYVCSVEDCQVFIQKGAGK